MVICSIREPSAEGTSRRLGQVPAGCGLVEIRADHLRADEVEGLVRRSPRPVVATVRGERDGGGFRGSEAERRRILLAALDAGARYVDVEIDGAQADLADAAPTRVILSHHGAACTEPELLRAYRRLAQRGAAVLKLVPQAATVGECAAVRAALALAAREGRALACFAAGRAGAISRLLAPGWGSWATYGSVAAGHATAPGQFTAAEMLDRYDVAGIGTATRRFALVGREVFSSLSPAMHRAASVEAAIDARLFPVEIDRFEDCLPLLGPQGSAGIEALAVTMPFKPDAAARCTRRDAFASRSGSVNTVLVREDGWVGFDTDGPAVLDATRRHLDPSGAAVAVVGAGGMARAAAAALGGAGARVTLYSRDPARGQAAAAALGDVAVRPLGRLADDRWDVLVQATPVGRKGERLLPGTTLRGRLVLDAVYGTETPLVADARARGLPVVDGLELLVGQAVLQFERMTGRRPRAATLRGATAGPAPRPADTPGSLPSP